MLVNLPPELLLRIADLLVMDGVETRKHLCRLLRANCRLYQTLQSRLFYHDMTCWKDPYIAEVARQGNLKAIRKSLTTPLGPTPSEQGLGTALIHAATHGHDAIVQLLLDKHPSLLDLKPGGQATALFHAAQHNHPSTVQLLLTHGANPLLPAGGSKTPLWAAVAGGPTEVVAIFTATGAHRRAESREFDILLWTAVQRGSVPITALLLDGGAPGQLSPAHQTARWCPPLLTTAARTGSAALIDLLVAHGADVTGQGSPSRPPPVYLAAQANNPDTAAALIRHGARVGYEDRWKGKGKGKGNQSRSVLYDSVGWMARLPRRYSYNTLSAPPPRRGQEHHLSDPTDPTGRNRQLALLTTLLDNGADPNDGAATSGLLAYALRCHRRDVAMLLLEHGAMPDTPMLLWAVRQRDYELTQALLEAGADPDVLLGCPKVKVIKTGQKGERKGRRKRRRPRSLLKLALMQGSQSDDLVRLLLDFGATPRDGELLPVVWRGDVILAQRLVQRGAQPGERELFVAVARRDTAMVRLLVNHGADSRELVGFAERYSSVEVVRELRHGSAHGEIW